MTIDDSSSCYNAIELYSVSKTYPLSPYFKRFLLSSLQKRRTQIDTNNNRNSLSSEFYALDGISLKIPQKTSLGIVGVNGAGKSTLLQIITGVIKASNGRLKVRGRVASLLELGSGFDPNFTGRENVFLNASILGLSREEIEDRMKLILDFAEIGDFIDRPVKSYSSGMTLRLAFSVITQVSADILIIDEALAVGDAIFVQKCMKFIRDFKKKGTLILVSHDFAALQSLCSECIWLSEGKIKSSGSTSEVLNQFHSFILTERNKQLFKSKSIRNASTISQNEAIEILDVKLRTINGKDIIDVKGDESVVLCVRFKSSKSIRNLILGFIVRNRLGLDLFSHRVELSGTKKMVLDDKNDNYYVNFEFDMPRLAKGVYMIYSAIAEKSSSGDVFHHVWSDSSFIFESSNTESFSGFFKIPMKNIKQG